MTPAAGRGTPARTLLGTYASALERERVYLLPDGLEVDTVSGGNISCRRVLFEDVLMVTLHRPRRRGGPLFCGLLGLFLALIGIALPDASDAKSVGFTLSIVGSALLLVCLVIRLVPAYTVTVFGKRGLAVMSFGWRQEKARQTFGRLCRLVQDSHRQLAAAVAAQAPSEPALPASLAPPAAPVVPPPLPPPG